MEKFIPKISPTMVKIRKLFKRTWAVFTFWICFIIFLLWVIHSEAERVHTELFLENSKQDTRLKSLEKEYK